MINKQDEIKNQLLNKDHLKNNNFWQYLSLAGQLGVIMVISIIVWFLLIRFLTNKFNLPPIWVVVGIIAGIATGMAGCYRKLKKILQSGS